MPKILYAQQSAWINQSNTGYNYGRQQTVRVYSSLTSQINGVYLQSDQMYGRTIVKFPSSLTAQSASQYVLSLTNVQNGLPNTDNITLQIIPIQDNWQQGNKYGDDGYCNFVYRSSGTQWQALTATGIEVTLDNVYDDISADITSLINNNITSFVVKMKDQTRQNGYRSYKSRHRLQKLFSPKIILYYDNQRIVDNSQFLVPNSRYTVYYKNYFNGQLADLNGVRAFDKVQFVGVSADVEYVLSRSATSNRISTGIYSATGNNIPLSATLYDSISAKWTLNGYGSIYTPAKVLSIFSSSGQKQQQITFSLGNKKSYYKKNQKINLKPRLFKYKNIRQLDGDPTTIISSNKMYYRIIDNKTKKQITDWIQVGLYNRDNNLILDFNNFFNQDDKTKYQLIFEFKIQDVYGQTLRFGQSIYDNCILTII